MFDKDLIRKINNGRCVAFVGSGPSCEIGYPSWEQLATVWRTQSLRRVAFRPKVYEKSTRAIRTTLERRLKVLQEPDEQLLLFSDLSEEEWADLDGQEQMDTLLTTRLAALKDERAEVKLLLDAARGTEAAGPDAKAEALLDWIYRLQQEESDPDLKVLVFTEFVPTQEMLREFLTDRGFSVVCLNGSLGMDERENAQQSFAGKARILVSTDAGGEGLNLQFCHVVVNYDIPWNPMKLEQRIGRVDRIGQAHAVRAVNFAIQDTVEHRVREVLEEKLAVILQEFGVDKTGDILDSALAGSFSTTCTSKPSSGRRPSTPGSKRRWKRSGIRGGRSATTWRFLGMPRMSIPARRGIW